jgi:hypothetical protein
VGIARGDGVAERALIAPDDRHLRARGDERGRDAPADAAAPAGDERMSIPKRIHLACVTPPTLLPCGAGLF